MAFADPQSVTINTVATPLPRISAGTNSSLYSSADGTVLLSASSQYGKRTRRTIRLSQSKVSADPLVPSQNTRSSMSAYIVVDVPVNGFTNTEAKYIVDALVAYLAASSGAQVTKLLGGEN